MSTHSARTHVDVRRRRMSPATTHVAMRRRTSTCGDVRRRMSMQDTADAKTICYLPLFITSPAQRNAMTDGNATYDDAVFVIAAIEIDYNVAVLV